ncbi:MAG: molybdenum cofactor biosynthesis protein MoaE [Sulfurospirillum sp.]|nr:molybdenum cofactor biosynthesis protein MoaE [Sulfurospirillum sp.]MBL0703627.1 molybdenum cofactor biosynthesis protein MoaE [Sulfurospirillum sp.]
MSLELHRGPLNVDEITNRWYGKLKDKNYGAYIPFIGIVRDENKISGLSFDIYEPILNSWFKAWQEKAKNKDSYLLMAHSIGDVPNHCSSYMSAVASPHRVEALKMISSFVEDFKVSAPIWKYDLINKERVYAKKRSTALKGAGLLK